MQSVRVLRANVDLGPALRALSSHTASLDSRLSAKVVRAFTANRHIDTVSWKSVSDTAAVGKLSGSAGRVLRNCTLEITGSPQSRDWRFKIYAPGWVYLMLIPILFIPPMWLPMLILLPLGAWAFSAGAPRIMEQIKTEIEGLVTG